MSSLILSNETIQKVSNSFDVRRVTNLKLSKNKQEYFTPMKTSLEIVDEFDAGDEIQKGSLNSSVVSQNENSKDLDYEFEIVPNQDFWA